MGRFATLLALVLTMSSALACASKRPSLGLDDEALRPQLPADLKYLVCEGHAKDADYAFVGNNGTGNQPLKLRGNNHQLHVSPGVIPQGQQHLFVIAQVPVAGAGCQVVVTKLSGGNILPVEDPYTLDIRCKKNDVENAERCPQNYRIIRIDPQVGEVGAPTTTDGRWMSVKLQTLSTYALATGVRIE